VHDIFTAKHMGNPHMKVCGKLHKHRYNVGRVGNGDQNAHLVTVSYQQHFRFILQ